MSTSLTILCLLGVFWPLLIFSLLEWRDRQRRKETEKSPQEEKLLRPPGYSLALRAENLWETFTDKILPLCFCGLMSVLMLYLSFRSVRIPDWRIEAFFTLPATVAFFYLAGHQISAARKLLRERRNCLLGLRGEQAVGEALTEVAPNGYRAFHDLPGGKDWNIDHVVVGPQGVFVIETKARRKRAKATGQPPNKVAYDAEKLYFPTGEDREAIPQACRNAKWVADFLTKQTGERVDTEPLVILPGWWVERAGPDTKGLTAMPPKYLITYLRNKPDTLPPAQVRRIIAALESQCRDVEF